MPRATRSGEVIAYEIGVKCVTPGAATKVSAASADHAVRGCFSSKSLVVETLTARGLEGVPGEGADRAQPAHPELAKGEERRRLAASVFEAGADAHEGLTLSDLVDGRHPHRREFARRGHQRIEAPGPRAAAGQRLHPRARYHKAGDAPCRIQLCANCVVAEEDTLTEIHDGNEPSELILVFAVEAARIHEGAAVAQLGVTTTRRVDHDLHDVVREVPVADPPDGVRASNGPPLEVLVGDLFGDEPCLGRATQQPDEGHQGRGDPHAATLAGA